MADFLQAGIRYHLASIGTRASRVAAAMCSCSAELLQCSSGDSSSTHVQLLEDLERSIASPAFLQSLERSRHCQHSEEGTEELDELLGDYVVVTKEDAVNAMASYIAAWLSTVPEAQTMDPKKLQGAILHGVKVCYSSTRSAAVCKVSSQVFGHTSVWRRCTHQRCSVHCRTCARQMREMVAHAHAGRACRR
jgi:hypothetical protein